ncbi:MAG: hypothetical protein ACI4SD_03550 [Suilimivivens sp.]
MKAKKKSKFLTFCFSLIPGAGEMYMGFMRMGVSLMLLFILSLLIPSVLRLDSFTVVAIVVWFYGFFHANHLVSLSDEEFDGVKDEYLLGVGALAEGRDFVAKYHKWVAGILIVAGVLLLWNTFTDIAYRFLPQVISDTMRVIGNYAPRILVAVAIIFIGVKMIQGRKEQLANLEQRTETDSENREA